MQLQFITLNSLLWSYALPELAAFLITSYVDNNKKAWEQKCSKLIILLVVFNHRGKPNANVPAGGSTGELQGQHCRGIAIVRIELSMRASR